MRPGHLSFVITLALVQTNARGAEAPVAEEEYVEEDEDVDTGQRTLVHYSHSYGLTVYIMTGLGVAALALTATLASILRREHLLPRELVEELEALLRNGEYEPAADLCAVRSGCLCRVVGAGLATREAGRDYVLRAVALAGRKEGALLRQHVRWLLVIAVVAVLVGLLGTVAGVMRTLEVIAAMDGTAIPADLADGIAQSLLSLVVSLVGAIPTLCAYVFFRNRAVALSLEVESTATDLLSRIRPKE